GSTRKFPLIAVEADQRTNDNFLVSAQYSRLLQFNTGKCFNHFVLCWGLQDAPCCEIFSMRILCVSNALSSFVEIVGRMPKLNLGAKQEPIRAWFPKRHAHTA